MADTAYGARVFVMGFENTPVEHDIAPLYALTPPSETMTDVDVTSYASPGSVMEFVGGMIDGGTLEVTTDGDPALPLYGNLRPIFENKSATTVKIVFADNSMISFPAVMNSWQLEAPKDDRRNLVIGFRVAGEATEGTYTPPV